MVKVKRERHSFAICLDPWPDAVDVILDGRPLIRVAEPRGGLQLISLLQDIAELVSEWNLIASDERGAKMLIGRAVSDFLGGCSTSGD